MPVTRRADGSYAFDFARFDRWCRLHFDVGFRLIEGRHVCGGGSVGTIDVWANDAATGERTQIFKRSGELSDDYVAFLEAWFSALGGYLAECGWTDRYVQHICDEARPTDMEEYERVAGMAHRLMPGVRLIDATGRPDIAQWIEIPVPSFGALAIHRDAFDAHRARGGTPWAYHTSGQPSRNLDQPLANSRVYPWMADLYRAAGYLVWSGNIYRGVDPFEFSVGPEGFRAGEGLVWAGHPPGSNWHFYPTPDGLTGSARMVAFREGLIDHALVQMLRAKDPARADALRERIARSLIDYETDPRVYHQVRRELLEALDAAE